jgi:hypothetical protein
VSEGERIRFVQEIDLGHIDIARQTATRLYEKDSLRKANRFFVEFRNDCVLHSLYFSSEVAHLLEDAVRRLALFSVYADELIEGERPEFHRRRQQSEKMEELSGQAQRLRKAMRNEMRAGFTPATGREAESVPEASVV